MVAQTTPESPPPTPQQFKKLSTSLSNWMSTSSRYTTSEEISNILRIISLMLKKSGKESQNQKCWNDCLRVFFRFMRKDWIIEALDVLELLLNAKVQSLKLDEDNKKKMEGLFETLFENDKYDMNLIYDIVSYLNYILDMKNNNIKFKIPFGELRKLLGVQRQQQT